MRNSSFSVALLAVVALSAGSVFAATKMSFITPSGGEVFIPGETYNVSLSANGNVKSITLELSTDNGVTFTQLGLTDDTVIDRPRRTFVWKIPATQSTSAVLRATGQVGASPVTALSSVFSIGNITGAGSGPLGPNSVTNPTIAPGAVDNTKISSTGISSGFVLSANGSGGTIWSQMSALIQAGSITTVMLAPGTTATNFSGNLVGDVTGTQGATAIAASTVTGKALTGFSSGAGAINASDSLLTAINKLDGNVALKAPLASPTFTGNVGIGATSATSKLVVAGVIESTSGGIKFPDGTTQTTAATGTGTGAAQFVRSIQAPNNSVPPGTAFTIDTQVINSVPAAIVASAGSGGTVYTLSTGVYVLDYEMSLGSAGSVGLYTGPTAGTLALDTNTIAGSSTATTWIHGRAMVVVGGSPVVVAVSSVVGTASVVTAGTAAGSFLIRLTVLKIQ